MNLSLGLFFWFYGTGSLILVLCIIFAQKKKPTTTKKISLTQLSVIIPFRNESKRIQPLLNCLKKQTLLPKAIFFVDDHSTDSSCDIIRCSLDDIHCETAILSLVEGEQGKKNAILLGAQTAKTSYIHTLDADVSLSSDFFKRIEHLTTTDMTILPVNLVGRGLLGRIMELEYGSFILIQQAFGQRKPLYASGANLLMNRENYLCYNTLDKHQHYASGDDQFVMYHFLRAKKTVSVVNDLHLSVTTAVPPTLSELFRQRLRWMSKNNALFEWRSFLISLYTFMLQLFFLGLTTCFALQKEHNLLLLLILGKIVSDFIQFLPFLIRKDKRKLSVILPFLSLLYPFYLCFLALLSLFWKPHWKGREIISAP